MNKKELLKQSLNINLEKNKVEVFHKYETLFIQKNQEINLISKNDEKLLFEKHIFDSLAINLFFNKNNKKRLESNQKLLDIGTGGGFPSIPISILFEELNVYALDSIQKKINVIDSIKTELKLDNLKPICDRAENLSKKEKSSFDYVTTRAVAPIETILKYAIPNLKEGGYFIAYKSKKAIDELKDAKGIIKRLNVKMVDLIEYTLPLEEIYERNLIVFQKG